MPEDWTTSVMVPIYKEKRDVMNCRVYRGVKLLKHRMKIIEKVLEKRIRAMVMVNPYAIWLYARNSDNRCSFYNEKNAKRIQEEG